MKITTIALSALGLAGLSAGQNGNDPLILNNRTALDPVVYDTFTFSYTDAPAVTPAISVPVTPSPVQSNTSIKPSTSIACWRNGHPCDQNGGQRSERLVADFVVPTPALEARVPPPEFFSTRTNVRVPGETDVPGEMPLDTLPPVAEPTGEVSMGILPIPTSLGGEPNFDAPSQVTTSEAILSVLPITTSTTAAGFAPIPTSWWRGPPGSTNGTSAPTQTAHCNGTVSAPSTSQLTPLPISTVSSIVQDPLLTPAPATSSHFAIPPDPNSPIIDTYTKSSASLELTPLPIKTVSGTIKDPLMTSAPATGTAPSMPVPEGMQNHFLHCGTNDCVPIDMAGLAACYSTSTPRAGPVAALEVTSPVAAITTAAREPITVTIDCNRHYCHSGMETVYTIAPTPYTYPIVPATSGFAPPPEVTHVDAANKAFIPIDWWRGPNESIVPDAPKTLEGAHGPIQRHSPLALVSSVKTDSPCHRYYCPSGHTPAKPTPTTMLTTSKPARPVVSVSMSFPAAPPSFETFTA